MDGPIFPKKKKIIRKKFRFGARLYLAVFRFRLGVWNTAVLKQRG